LCNLQQRTLDDFTYSPGQLLSFSTRGSSDPDEDELHYRWYWYPEAGTFAGASELPGGNEAVLKFSIPAAKTEVNLILEVQDGNPIASLHNYQHMVLRIKE